MLQWILIWKLVLMHVYTIILCFYFHSKTNTNEDFFLYKLCFISKAWLIREKSVFLKSSALNEVNIYGDNASGSNKKYSWCKNMYSPTDFEYEKNHAHILLCIILKWFQPFEMSSNWLSFLSKSVYKQMKIK